MQLQQGCFKKCSLLTVEIKNAIITDWAKCDEATSQSKCSAVIWLLQLLLVFVVDGGGVLDSLEISVPCIACELVLLNLIEFCH